MPANLNLVRTLTTLVLTMTLISGCAAASPQPFSVLEQGSAAMTTEDFTFAAALEQRKWEQLYAQIHAHRLPAPQPPMIDWEKNLVVLVASGWKPSAGYRVNINRIERRGTRLQAFVEVDEPPAGSLQLTVMTQPYVLALIERPERLQAIEFVDSSGKALHRLEVSLP